MVAIQAHCKKHFDMTQRAVFDCMDKMQLLIKQAKPSNLPYIVDYPHNAESLPDAIKKHAYIEGVLLVKVDLPELEIILGENKMRGCPDEAKRTA